MPVAGYCGEETLLSCSYTAENALWSWEKNGETIIMGGQIAKAKWTKKYRAHKNNQNIFLTVNNTDMSDEGKYSCAVGNITSTQVQLKVECKCVVCI